MRLRCDTCEAESQDETDFSDVAITRSWPPRFGDETSQPQEFSRTLHLCRSCRLIYDRQIEAFFQFTKRGNSDGK